MTCRNGGSTRKQKKWKITIAAVAVVLVGVAYCLFFKDYLNPKGSEDGVLYLSEDGSVKNPTEPKSDGNTASEAMPDGGDDVGRSAKERPTEGSVAEAQLNGKEAEKGNNGSIYVHVCGEVMSPGVYELSKTARVFEAIEAAGGLTEAAAGELVNQASVLSDGERLYIPDKEALKDTDKALLIIQQGSFLGASTDTGKEKLVNINTAGIDELTTLPGIGESRAESIISFRKQHGLFRRIEDIMEISGIKEAAFEKIKDWITVGEAF